MYKIVKASQFAGFEKWNSTNFKFYFSLSLFLTKFQRYVMW